MSLRHVLQAVNMIYVLCYYLIAAVRLTVGALWYTFVLLGAGLPWLLAAIVAAWCASQFVKLRSAAAVRTPLAERLRVQRVEVDDADGEDDGRCRGKNPPLYWPVAERGAEFDAPENSVAALQMCHATGCDMVLLDLAVTRCGTAVILHKGSPVARGVDINTIDLAQLREGNISQHHTLRDKYPAENVLTLAELMHQLRQQLPGMTVFLRLPADEARAPVLDALRTAIETDETMFRERIAICSDSLYTLHLLRKVCAFGVCSLWVPKLPPVIAEPGLGATVLRVLMVPMGMLVTLRNALQMLLAPYVGIAVVFLCKDEYNACVQKGWQAVGVRPIVYSVNSPNEKLFYQRHLRTQYVTGSLRTEPQHLLGHRR